MQGDAREGGLPLSGKVVLVTRAAGQEGALTERLVALGAEVLAMPVIRVADPEHWGPADAAMKALDTFDWLVLTSSNGVERFFSRLDALGRDAGGVTGARVAVVGRATAQALQARGLEPGMVPESFRSEGLVESFRSLPDPDETRVLIARAADARELLPDQLRALGFDVSVVPVYRLLPADSSPEALARLVAGEVDIVTLSSGGIARRFFEVLRQAGTEPLKALRGVCVASIGPVTSQALRELGREPDVEATEADAGSLVEALVEALAGKVR
jgi:uroporphyrinogen III methyltransferase/synthase